MEEDRKEQRGSVRRSHDKAMRFAQLALVARSTGSPEKARALSKVALMHELDAVTRVPGDTPETEPTRSILYRSAASLAFCAGEFISALGLVQEGLTETTPRRVRHELLTLRQDIMYQLNSTP